MIYYLGGLLFLSVFMSLVYRTLWIRESRLRQTDNSKMMDCYIPTQAEKVSQRKLEVLIFKSPSGGKDWLPTIEWKRKDHAPTFVQYIVRAPIPGQPLDGKDPGEIVAEFEIDFHDPQDYAVHFRKEVFFRKHAEKFHYQLRKYVEASAPWNKDKHFIHRSKAPNKEDPKALAAAS